MADRSISQREHFPPSVCSVAATHNPFLWFLHFYLSYLDLLLRCRYNQSFISRLTICCHSLLLLVNQSWSYCWFLLTNGCHCFSWLFSFSSILTNFIVYRSFPCLVQLFFFLFFLIMIQYFSFWIIKEFQSQSCHQICCY